MKVLITGGTGFLGVALRRRLETDGHFMTVVSRTRRGGDDITRFIGEEELPQLEPQDAVINLAGESVAGLWTASKRKRIYASRVDTTRRLAEWIDRSPKKPTVFLSGSAVGIYGDTGDQAASEKTDVSAAEGFLAKVCRDWENAASSVAWHGTRTVLLRTSQVLHPSGGYLGKVLPILRNLPIVVLGQREAYFPWIALDDWVELVLFAMTNDSVSGALNLVAPQEVTQGEFTDAMAKALRKRVWGRVPRWALKLGAGEFGESITFSERVVPEKALSAGFEFRHPTLEPYLTEILRGNLAKNS